MGLFTKDKTKLNHLAAEMIGTFFLTKVVLLSLGGQIQLAVPLAASLTLLVFVYTVGTMSGAHLNPAITIGLLSTKKIKTIDATWYIISQVIGASLALLSVFLIFGINPPSTDGILWQLVLGEFIGTFILAWGVYSVASGKTPQAASGLTISASLLLGILIASPLSNAILNPALALGIGSASITYILTPILASITSMLLYKHLESCKIKL